MSTPYNTGSPGTGGPGSSGRYESIGDAIPEADPIHGSHDTYAKGEVGSIGGLVSDISSDLSTLMRQEMQLAKVEIKQEVRTAGKAGGLLGGGAGAGYMALLFLSAAIAILIALIMPSSLSEFARYLIGFLLVGAIYAVAAVVLLNKGKEQMKKVDPVPQQTVETLKEDAQWAKTQARS